LLATHEYSAVTLDLVLADGDGSELLPELSRRMIPVIVISGSNRELGRAAVFVTDKLSKPYREEQLLATILRVTERKASTPRVLHIEDDADLRRIVRRTLPAEWEVEGAESMWQARRLLAGGRFDAVVIDLALPDGNGAELISSCRDARVIVFSAQDISGDLARRVSSALVKTRSTAEDLRDVLVSLLGEGRSR
jgi:DNA-binding response OmpR family regulator